MSVIRPDSTCWLIIDGAARGRREDRNLFALLYEPVIRAYLGARWRQAPLRAELDDAVQEVFVECFQPDGLLAKVDRSRPGGFRAYLYGAARFIALRFERRAGRRRERPLAGAFDLDAVEADDPSLSQAFDRAWAQGVLRRAREVQHERAKHAGPEALRRFQLLRIRFEEGLPIRDIARLWETDAAQLHKEYARARREFKEALVEVVSFHHPGETAAVVERECVRLLDLVRQ